jgi:photosystem II stability/assembly factor-like uncharacterized protein
MRFFRLILPLAIPILAVPAPFGCTILSAQSAQRVGDREAPPSQSGNFAVWQIQESGTTAGLRGIDSVDGTVAWASGTGGTVLRTIDGGGHWTNCATPDADKDGATLDFRGVQAWDAQTAIVMASGPGDKSRLYKTTDGCRTWTRLYSNKDKAGFWDGVVFWDRQNGLLLGDPTETRFEGIPDDELNPPHLEFTVLFTVDGGESWRRQQSWAGSPLAVVGLQDAAAFAASNSSLAVVGHTAWIGTGGKKGPHILVGDSYNVSPPGTLCDCSPMPPYTIWFTHSVSVPLAGGNNSSGIFSLHFVNTQRGVAVGGDYTKPNDSAGTAAFSTDGGAHWTASTTPPHGYRSTVQWSEPLHIWVTAGTNGSDISRDDGKTWQPLDNGNWNALSLPFIVGPNGRIARLNPQAIPKP